jgi:hypothetical protein
MRSGAAGGGDQRRLVAAAVRGQPVLGRTVRLNRSSYTIVGVAEASFVGSFLAR